MHFQRFLGLFDWAARIDFASTLLGAIFDWRQWVSGFAVSAVTFIWAALREWDPLAVWLATLGAGAFVSIIYIAWTIFLANKKTAASAPAIGTPLGTVATTDAPTSKPEPDIDARDAFFQILERSEWRQHQLRTTTDTRHLVRDWLEVRLSDEIHKAVYAEN
jgi:hypothetical protein